MLNRKLKLNCLSNSEVISRLESLVKSEKEITTEVIRHLAEVDRRRLYSSLGYRSLFDYAVTGLGYSNSAATRRIKVARAGVKLPAVFTYLDEDKVTLSSLNVCTDLLLGEQGEAVLEELKWKSKEQAEWLLASYQPVAQIRDRVEKVFVGNVSAAQRELFNSDKNSSYIRCELEERYKLSFSADEDFMEKLKRVQELMFTGKKEDLKLEKILGEALDLVIEKYCPRERLQRREVRLLKKGKGIIQRKRQANPRYIPVPLRDEVLKRDNYECTYEGFQGHKCKNTFGLEIDHIVPFAKGGKTENKNLRVLCSAHNKQAAIDEFGLAFISKRIEQAREA